MEGSTKPANYKPLLTIANAKTIKGEKLGYLTGILYLAPATKIRRANMCPFATAGCMRDCLFTAGRGAFQEIKKARIAKTRFLLHHVAVVFDTHMGEPLPATWHGYRIIDGDLHDLRFLDPPGVVVGLRAKGQARNDETSGFVVLSSTVAPGVHAS